MTHFDFTVTGGTPDQQRTVLAATSVADAALSAHLAGDAVLTVPISIETLPGNQLAWGSSVETFQLGPNLWEPVAGHELRTGEDANGARPDGLIRLDIDKVASSGADLVGVLEHEALHVIGMDGFFDGTNKTPFETLIQGGFFTGTAAQSVYGGPIPMGSGPHVGIADLMNPGREGSGNSLSLLDVAILSDIGEITVERFGTKAADLLTADTGGNPLYGGSGNDTLLGSQSADFLAGSADADDLEGRGGADTLNGGDGPDSLAGGKGDDWLLGGEGEDTLAGQIGDDTLDGGYGPDLFIFRPGDGNDHIQHFETADRLSLPANYSVTVNRAAMETVITYEGGSVTLEQTTAWDAAWLLLA